MAPPGSAASVEVEIVFVQLENRVIGCTTSSLGQRFASALDMDAFAT